MDKMLLDGHASKAKGIAQGLIGEGTDERLEAFASLVWLAIDMQLPGWPEIRTKCWKLQIAREVEWAADPTIELRFVPSKQNLCDYGRSLAGIEQSAEQWYADAPKAPESCRRCTCYFERVLEGDR